MSAKVVLLVAVGVVAAVLASVDDNAVEVEQSDEGNV
jgi:hypothetical protein